jgi:hypothetical protein
MTCSRATRTPPTPSPQYASDPPRPTTRRERHRHHWQPRKPEPGANVHPARRPLSRSSGGRHPAQPGTPGRRRSANANGTTSSGRAAACARKPTTAATRGRHDSRWLEARLGIRRRSATRIYRHENLMGTSGCAANSWWPVAWGDCDRLSVPTPLPPAADVGGGYDKVWLLAGVSVMRSTRRPRLSRDRGSRLTRCPRLGRSGEVKSSDRPWFGWTLRCRVWFSDTSRGCPWVTKSVPDLPIIRGPDMAVPVFGGLSVGEQNRTANQP